jgi:hypothetical protein
LISHYAGGRYGRGSPKRSRTGRGG